MADMYRLRSASIVEAYVVPARAAYRSSELFMNAMTSLANDCDGKVIMMDGSWRIQFPTGQAQQGQYIVKTGTRQFSMMSSRYFHEIYERVNE